MSKQHKQVKIGKCGACHKENVEIVERLGDIDLCQECHDDFNENTIKQHENIYKYKDLVDKNSESYGKNKKPIK